MLNLIDSKTQKIIDILLKNSSREESVFLVGGIVRDLLLNKSVHDFDISFRGDVIAYAKKIADSLGASFFMLNEKFQTARILFKNNKNISIDIVGMRGDSIVDDLQLRDFTINAMAIDLKNPDDLIDPCHGAFDLKEKRLRVCSESSFKDDPVRILRAIRQSIKFELIIDQETLKLLKMSSVGLTKVTPERIRDELVRMFELPEPTIAVNILEHLKLIDYILPEVNSAELLKLNLPNTKINLWENTVQTIKNLIILEHLLVGEFGDNDANSLRAADATQKLGRFRNKFNSLFKKSIHQDRSINSLFILTCLFKNIDVANEISFSNIEENKSGKLLEAFDHRAQKLALSKKERRWGISVLNGQRLFHAFREKHNAVDGKDIYQYFRISGEGGVFACLLALADTLTMQLEVGFEDIWYRELEIARILLEGYWEKNSKFVNPPDLINGHELLKMYPEVSRNLIGFWLEKVKEGTASGLIQNKKDAATYLETLMSNPNQNLTNPPID